MTIHDAITRSSRTFVDVVWPAFSGSSDIFDVYPVETIRDSPIAGILDMQAGIDVIVMADNQPFAISSRVQYLKPPWDSWDTFTLRSRLRSGAPTELEKRTKAILSGAITPRYHIQGYVTEGSNQLVAAAMVEMDHLIELANYHRHQVRVAPGGNEFIWINWSQCDPAKIIIRRASDMQGRP